MRQSSPSDAARPSASACSASKGDRDTWRPVRVVGWIQRAASKFITSALQGCRSYTTMADRAFDFLERFEAVPEHRPLIALEAAIAFLGIELVDRIVRTRTPEQFRRLG